MASVKILEPAASAYRHPLLIRHLLHTPAYHARSQEIVYRGETRHDYAGLQRRIARLAHVLQAAGIGPGDTVAVLDWDSHRYLEAFFAVPMMGAVLQTVNVRLSPEQVRYTLEHAAPRLLMVHGDFSGLLATLPPALRGLPKVLLEGALEGETGLVGSYEELLVAAPDAFDFRDFDENACATTFYTTGTTGLPKAVHFSHRQLVLHTLAQTAALALPHAQGGLHHGDVYMPLTPMFHVHAWGVPYTATLAGLKQVYPGRYEPAHLLRLIRSEGVTFSHCVPTILKMVLDEARSQSANLSGWKVIVGGAALPRSLAAEALARGIDVFAGYGMSETCPLLTVSRVQVPGTPDEELAVRTAAGIPAPLVDLRVVDPDLNELPRDGRHAGEIVARAPWLTQSYVGNADASQALWAGGHLHTGDIGTMDDSGYLRITDRVKDVIKTGGEWLSSLELEELISAHPQVVEAAVIGVPDAKWGERPAAFVVPRAGGPIAAGDVADHLRAFAESGRIPRYAVPEQIRFVDALPRTSVGKIDKKALRQWPQDR